MYTTRNNPCYVHFEPKTAKIFFWLFAIPLRDSLTY